MAAFDQIRLLHLKKYLICTLLILKRRKYLCWSLFFNKVAGPATLWKERCSTQVFSCEICKAFKNTFFTEYLRLLLLENLFRSSRERRLHITGKKIYAVIWLRLLLLLVQNVSSCVRITLMFGCLSYFYKGDKTETAYITKSTSLRYFAITCYWRCFCSHWC